MQYHVIIQMPAEPHNILVERNDLFVDDQEYIWFRSRMVLRFICHGCLTSNENIARAQGFFCICMNISTTCGSKYAPDNVWIYSSTLSSGQPLRCGRSERSASHTSTTAKMRAATGILSSFKPF